MGRFYLIDVTQYSREIGRKTKNVRSVFELGRLFAEFPVWLSPRPLRRTTLPESIDRGQIARPGNYASIAAT